MPILYNVALRYIILFFTVLYVLWSWKLWAQMSGVRENMKTLDFFFDCKSHYIYYQHSYFSTETQVKEVWGFFCSRWYLIVESCQKSLWHSDSDSPHGVQTEVVVVVVAETDRQMEWWSCKRESYIKRLAARRSTVCYCAIDSFHSKRFVLSKQEKHRRNSQH